MACAKPGKRPDQWGWDREPAQQKHSLGVVGTREGIRVGLTAEDHVGGAKGNILRPGSKDSDVRKALGPLMGGEPRVSESRCELLVVEGIGTERNRRILVGFRSQDPLAPVVCLTWGRGEGPVKADTGISVLPWTSQLAQLQTPHTHTHSDSFFHLPSSTGPSLVTWATCHLSTLLIAEGFAEDERLKSSHWHMAQARPPQA